MENTSLQRAAVIAALSDDDLNAMVIVDHPGMERLRAAVCDDLQPSVDDGQDPERWDGLS